MKWSQCSFASILTSIVAAALAATTALAQPPHRGQYLSGLELVNPGTMPDPGITYANIFYFVSAYRLKGPNGGPIPVSGQFSVMADNNFFVYVTKFKILGANIGLYADIPVANGNLAALLLPASPNGVLLSGGGGGLADTWFSPFVLGWHFKRADIQAGYSFFAPTGRYTPGATNNIGVGFWTNSFFGAATVYLTTNKALSANAWSLYEFHTTQQGTNITPGQTQNLDYSVLQFLPLNKKETILLQVGPVAYGQWQTTNNGGQSPILSRLRYGVNAVGLTANVVLPERKASIGMRYLWQYAARNTYEGQTLMITAGLTF